MNRISGIKRRDIVAGLLLLPVALWLIARWRASRPWWYGLWPEEVP